MLLGVDDDEVAGAHRRGVEGREQALLEPAGAAVAGGVGGEDEHVVHDRDAAEQQAGEQHVEVAEVADQHDVGPAGPAGAAHQHPPHPGQLGEQPRQAPGLLQQAHARRGVEPQRLVALLDGHAVPAQALQQDRHARVRLGVVTAESQQAHAEKVLATSTGSAVGSALADRRAGVGVRSAPGGCSVTAGRPAGVRPGRRRCPA